MKVNCSVIIDFCACAAILDIMFYTRYGISIIYIHPSFIHASINIVAWSDESMNMYVFWTFTCFIDCSVVYCVLLLIAYTSVLLRCIVVWL